MRLGDGAGSAARERSITVAGVTTLSGASGGFSGATTVSGGTLLVDGTLGGTVAVGNGASLGGIGELDGAVSIANGGMLLGQQGETLTMVSLALGNASNVNVALGAPGTLALFDVIGNLTLDGLLNVEDLGGFGAGVYRIFDYGGVLTNNSMDIGSTPAGVLASALSMQTAIAGEVNLVNSTVASIFNVWGGGSGVWNTTNSNWTDARRHCDRGLEQRRVCHLPGQCRHRHRGSRRRHRGRWYALRSRRLHDHRRPDRAAK